MNMRPTIGLARTY